MNNITSCTSHLISGAALGACTIGAVPGSILGGITFLTIKVIDLTGLPQSIQKSLNDYPKIIQAASMIAQVVASCFLIASISVATGLSTTSIPITAGFVGATFLSAVFFDVLIFESYCGCNN